jgi:hypothetical protein
MERFIEENTVFIASVIALVALIAGASALAQKGTVNYTYQPTAAATATATAAKTQPASQPIQQGSVASTAKQTTTTVAPKTPTTPAVQPSIRHRHDDDGRFGDN